MLKSLLLSQIANSVIRHVMTALGGYLMAQGLADEGTVSEISGGVIAASGVFLSWAEKQSR